jgi:hypothetical protein
MNTKVTKAAPPRIVVGTDYYLASGIIRSRTQFNRLRKSGRITELFNVGSRLGQWKDLADRDLARLIERPGSDEGQAA